MIFQRPKDVTLTDMAKWLDANSYSPEKDNDKLVEYLYHIIYYNAQKMITLPNYEDYEDFTLFCVSKFLVRFDNKKEQPLKSVVNYLRVSIDHWRAEYIREFCSGSPDIEMADFNVSDFSDYLVDVTSEYDYNKYNFFCTDVTDVIRKHLRKIPYKKKSAEWVNIYTSCMLTLRDRIYSAAKKCETLDEEQIEYINKVIRELKTKEPILYHLEEDKSTYVSVLVNEMVHALAAELTHTVHSKVSPSDCLKNLVKAANNEEEDN